MPEDAPRPAQAAIRTDLGAIFVSLELSRRAWLITSLSSGPGRRSTGCCSRRDRGDGAVDWDAESESSAVSGTSEL